MDVFPFICDGENEWKYYGYLFREIFTLGTPIVWFWMINRPLISSSFLLFVIFACRSKQVALVERYNALQKPMSIRKQRLLDSLQVQQLFRDVEDEEAWIREKEPVAASTNRGKYNVFCCCLNLLIYKFNIELLCYRNGILWKMLNFYLIDWGAERSVCWQMTRFLSQASILSVFLW